MDERHNVKAGKGRGRFVLSTGPDGTFGHVDLVLHHMSLPGEVAVEWHVADVVCDEVRQEVQRAVVRFLDTYLIYHSILLCVTITEVKTDAVRRNDYERAVCLALRAGLHQMGLPVPQLYAAPGGDPTWKPGS